MHQRPGAREQREGSEQVGLELAALADIQATAHEGAQITVVPGGYGPPCPRHETLSHNASTFEVTIDVDGAKTTMFDVFNAWRSGGEPSIVVASPNTAAFRP